MAMSVVNFIVGYSGRGFDAAASINAGSSNGRKIGSDPISEGSNPSPAVFLAKEPYETFYLYGP